MNVYIALLLITILPPFVVILLPKNRHFFTRPIVRGFGLGVYSALILVLLREGLEHGGTTITAIWFSIGLFISFCIGMFVKEFHHHHEHDATDHHDHGHSKASTMRLLISDFFHNIVDGIALVASFAVSPNIGLTSLFGILGHQAIQQSGQQVLLVESGITPKKALIASFLVSLSVFLGLIIQSESLEAIFICLSAGIVLWKVVTDIRHTRWSKKAIMGFIFGACLLIALLILIPHE